VFNDRNNHLFEILWPNLYKVTNHLQQLCDFVAYKTDIGQWILQINPGHTFKRCVCKKTHFKFGCTVKPGYIDHPGDPKKVAVVQRVVRNFVVIFAGLGILAGRCWDVGGRCSEVDINTGLTVCCIQSPDAIFGIIRPKFAKAVFVNATFWRFIYINILKVV
jgi:hypothetical protein